MRELTEKLIEITVSLNVGEPEAPIYEKVTFSGLRIKVAVVGGTMASQGQLQASIHGLTPDMMARLTTTGYIRQSNNQHRILVAAGDKGGVLSTVYEGTIYSAYCSVQQPISEFQLLASSAMGADITPVGASSFKGAVSVSEIMATLAKTAGYDFENNKVTATLNNPYFTGTTWEKIARVARAAGIVYAINNNKLSIWNDGAEAKEDIIISSEPNNVPQMIGTPSVGGSGLSIRTLFYPSFDLTKSYEVKSSDYPLANGQWVPVSVMHDLECLMPNGAWFTQVEFKRSGIGT